MPATTDSTTAAGRAAVEHLAAVWRSIMDLCADLTDDEWRTPTGCPGWTVQDNLSHLVDYESRALGRAAPDHEPPDLPHVRNDLGRANEVGVDARRRLSGAEVLAELAEVTSARLAGLRALGDDDFAAETVTPAGPGTLADTLRVRLMDTWSHEQDVRRALGRPGNDDTPAAEAAVGYFLGFLPYVVGKRAGAPDGTTVVLEVGSLAAAAEVVEGRGREVEPPAAPTARLRVSVAAFAALAGGRSDAAPGEVEVEGDADLAKRVVDGLGLMP